MNDDPRIELNYSKDSGNSYTVGKGEIPTLRQKIFALEDIMRQMPQREIKVFHHFSKGVYAREIHIPADTTLTGEIHKFENLNILSQGEMTVSTEDGVVRVKAPFTVVSPPGTKRVAYTHTDCVWTTIHGTDEIDIEKIKEFFIASSEAEYLEFVKNDQLLLDI